MKTRIFYLMCRMAMLSLLMCLSVSAWAQVTSTYNSSTNTLIFSGSGEVTKSIVQSSAGYSEATSVTFDAGISSIGEEAFSGTNLTSVKIPSNITTIKKRAFWGCQHIRSIEFLEVTSASVLQIQAEAFGRNNGIPAEEVIFKCYRNFSYTPSTGEDTYIGSKGLFSGNSSLTSVQIGYYVEYIPSYTFYNCGMLMSLSFTTGGLLKTINDYAFYGCVALPSTLTFPENVSTLGDYAFWNCSNLQYAVFEGDIPQNMGVNVFPATTAYFSKKNQTYEQWLASYPNKNSQKSIVIPNDAVANHAYMESSNLHHLFPNLEKVIFEASVTKVHAHILNATNIADSHLSQVVFKSAADLGYAAFTDNPSLTTIIGSIGSVDEWTFAYCDNLLGPITILNDNLIDDTSFGDCSSLDQVIFGENVRCISTDAFDGCSSLKKVTINSSYVANPSESYDDVDNLLSIFPYAEEITFGANVKTIGYDACYCEDSSTAKLKKVTFLGTPIISDNAFFQCSALTTIEGSVEAVGECSFEYSGISSIVITNDFVIDAEAFNDCPNLTSVTLPVNVMTIEDGAFGNCPLLKSVTLPASITTLGSAAFQGSNVQSLTILGDGVANPAKAYTIVGEENTLSTIFPNLKEVTFGPQVTKVGSDSFNIVNDVNYPLASVTFQGVTEVGNNAFQNTHLSQINGNVKGVGSYAFANTAISVVTITDDTVIDNSAFMGCTALTTVSLPANLVVIVDHAFDGCTALKTIEIPANTAALDAQCFANCTSLQAIHIPAAISIFENDVFKNCTSLKDVTIDSNDVINPSKSWSATSNVAKEFPYVETLTLGEAITSVKDYAFYGSPLKTLRISGADFQYATYTFEGCNAWKHVIIENNAFASKDWTASSNLSHLFPNITHLTFGSAVQSVGNCAFCKESGSHPLTMLTFMGAPTIGMKAFQGLSSLKTVEGEIKNPGASAFRDCSQLTSINIIEASSIPAYCFRSCSSLSEVNLPTSNLEGIMMEAFGFCSSLQSIVLPASVVAYGVRAFLYCSSLESVTCYNLVPVELTESMGIFEGISSSAVLRVPVECEDLYRNAPVWRDFYDFLSTSCIEVLDGKAFELAEDVEVPKARYSRSFSYRTAGNWQCLYVPFDIDVTSSLLEGYDFAKLYMVSYRDCDGNGIINGDDALVMVLSKVVEGETLLGNMPYFVRAKSAGKLIILQEDCTVYAAEEGTVDCRTTQDEYILRGVYQQTNINGLYTLNADGTFSYYDTDTMLKPNRWYMEIKSRYDKVPKAYSRPIEIRVEGEDNLTDIIDYEVSDAFSVDTIYTLDGHKVSNTQSPGIYIKNGKKVLVK